MSSKNIPQVIFVLGAPGSGKGTQCSNIVKYYGFKHLSAGDLLREEQARPQSQYGAMIRDKIKNGLIVPVEVTAALLERAMEQAHEDKFLIDGFPRNQDNMTGWNRCMEGKVKLLLVLFFDCLEQVCQDRCLQRGAAGSGRTDDNIESLKKRFNTYINDTMPIIEHYDKLSLVRKVDATPGPEDVFESVKAILLEAGIPLLKE